MDGAFNTRRRKRRPAITITPLIDVVFLLLIFFMVSTTFGEPAAIDITLPAAETGADQERPPYEIAVTAHSGPVRSTPARPRARVT